MIGCTLLILFGAADEQAQQAQQIQQSGNMTWNIVIFTLGSSIIGLFTLWVNKKFDTKVTKLESDVKECAEDRETMKVDLNKCNDKHKEMEEKFNDERKHNQEYIKQLVEKVVAKHIDDQSKM